MRQNVLRGLVLAAVWTGAAMVTGEAAAQSNVVELHTVTGEQGKLVVAVSGNGVTFIKPKTPEVFRAFKSSRTSMRGYSPDWFQIRDVDKDGTVDVIGAGKPAYIISGSAAPIYAVPRGCAQFHLGDFDGDKSIDIFCRNGASLQLFSYDGQKLWDYKIQGLRLGVCNFGDINGDLAEDIECEILGKGGFLRLGGNLEDLGQRDSAQLSAPEDDTPGLAAKMADTLSGEETFDLNGDGTAEESILMDGTAVVVRSRAASKAIARHEVGKISSVLVEDIDGDNKLEIVLGGQGKVFIIDDKGALTATLNVDPKKLKRTTDVQITRINANGLEDVTEATNRAAVGKAMGKLSACYAGNVRKNPFTRVGNAVFALGVDNSGKVKKVERLHNALDDKRVEGCIKKALAGVKLPKANAPGASVTVTLEFGFIDK